MRRAPVGIAPRAGGHLDERHARPHAAELHAQVHDLHGRVRVGVAEDALVRRVERLEQVGGARPASSHSGSTGTSIS